MKYTGHRKEFRELTLRALAPTPFEEGLTQRNVSQRQKLFMVANLHYQLRNNNNCRHAILYLLFSRENASGETRCVTLNGKIHR